jgi:myo-inositol-1(or 4)-monophosphatase
VIYDPTRDELFTAERGRGAWFNGKRFRVSRIPELAESLIATGFPSRKRHDSPNVHFYQEFTLRSHGVRRAGSAALDLAWTACGRMEAFWEFNLNPWDTAAGILLVIEAGGRVTDFAGNPFELNSREILATNGLIHDEMVGLFKDLFAGRNLTPIPTPAEFAARRAAREASAR